MHYWFLYFMDLPDTELAAVLAHEIAHVLAQHHVSARYSWVAVLR